MYIEDLTGKYGCNFRLLKNDEGEWKEKHNHHVIGSSFNSIGYTSVYCYNRMWFRVTPPELWRCSDVRERTTWEDYPDMRGRAVGLVVLDECPSNSEPGSQTKCARK